MIANPYRAHLNAVHSGEVDLGPGEGGEHLGERLEVPDAEEEEPDGVLDLVTPRPREVDAQREGAHDKADRLQAHQLEHVEVRQHEAKGVDAHVGLPADDALAVEGHHEGAGLDGDNCVVREVAEAGVGEEVGADVKELVQRVEVGGLLIERTDALLVRPHDRVARLAVDGRDAVH